MRLTHFEAFAPVCPVCRQNGRGLHALTLAQVADRTPDEVVTGILHCANAACQYEYPIVDGIPIIVPDVPAFLSERAVEAMLRDDLDPALESLFADALGPDSWYAALRQNLSTYIWDAWADLDPEERPAAAGASRPGAARRCIERLLQIAGPRTPPDRLLDLGCAGGRTSVELAARYPQGLVLGIDASLALLRVARAAAAGEVSYPRRRIGVVYDRRRFPTALPGRERVDFWACDVRALPFQAGTVDLVAALNILDCVTEPRRLLGDIEAVLTLGGRGLFATPYDWATRATPMETWIGGHSQRASHGGAAEPFLRQLLTPGAHPQSTTTLRMVAEEPDWPWSTRLHDRGAVHYSSHLFAVEKAPA